MDNVLYAITNHNGIGRLHCSSHDSQLQIIKQPGQKEIDGVIDSLVVDSREGMMYYLKDLNPESTIFALNMDGSAPPQKLMTLNQKAIRISIDGEFLYWIQKSVKSFDRIMRLGKRDKQSRPIFESNTKISGMAMGTFKRTNDTEICSKTDDKCLDRNGNMKCLTKNNTCDKIPDCYGDFDEFYCCYQSDICGIQTVSIELIKSEENQSLVTTTSEWQGHPFSNLVLREVFATSLLKINANYKDVAGRKRNILIHNLGESHILRQFLAPGVFRNVNFTRTLTLTGYLGILKEKAFTYFHALQSLSIKNTLLKSISNYVFNGLFALINLEIMNNAVLRDLGSNAFDDLTSLETLDISSNALTELQKGTLENLKSLKQIDLRGNDLTVTANYFTRNPSLNLIKADSYTFCCLAPLIQCDAPKLTGTGCKDLIESNVLRICLWIIGTTALLANLAVIVYRFVGEGKSKHETFKTFATNLSIADTMMGIYMLIIGIQDAKFKGNYVMHEHAWKNDYLCIISGILAWISSESSVIFILLITVDRILAVKFPMTGPRITNRSAYILSAASWVIAFITAIIPGLLYKKFYSYSGVCMALPLTTYYVAGKHYNVAVFLGFNFVLFILIAFGQFFIYREIQISAKRVRSTVSAKDRYVAKMLLMIVISDCCCWLPIGILIIMTLCGVVLPELMYAWLVVFVLPINSALNPFLYTIAPELKKMVNQRKRIKMIKQADNINLKTTKEKQTGCQEIEMHIPETRSPKETSV